MYDYIGIHSENYAKKIKSKVLESKIFILSPMK